MWLVSGPPGTPPAVLRPVAAAANAHQSSERVHSPVAQVREYTYDGLTVRICESALGDGVGGRVWGAATLFCDQLVQV